MSEPFYTLLEDAFAAARTGLPASAVTEAFLAAHAASPGRAEPLVALAQYFRRRNEPSRAYIYACAATQLEVPADPLFDREAYSWRALRERASAAFALGRYPDTHGCLEELLARPEVPPSQRPLFEANLAATRARLTTPNAPSSPGLSPWSGVPERDGYLCVMPTLGLANLLRVTFSYRALARRHGVRFAVLWQPQEACPAHFHGLFQRIPDVTILRENVLRLRVHYRGYEKHGRFPPDYADLKPLPHVQERIHQLLARMNGRFIAVHMRRTDHVALAQRHDQYTPDSDFHAFIDANLREDEFLYLATDNAETQRTMIGRYGDRVVVHGAIQEKPGELRHTSVEDAVVDVFVCARARRFQPSGYSSFSDLIEALRQRR